MCFPYKPSILVYSNLWKPPYDMIHRSPTGKMSLDQALAMTNQLREGGSLQLLGKHIATLLMLVGFCPCWGTLGGKESQGSPAMHCWAKLTQFPLNKLQYRMHLLYFPEIRPRKFLKLSHDYKVVPPQSCLLACWFVNLTNCLICLP